jgi:hypothetical protein
VGVHEAYGKDLLSRTFGTDYVRYGQPVEVDFGVGNPGRIDGVLDGRIAVEIDSRTSKQVRGAVLDLICHTLTRKLLVLVPAHMSDAMVAAAQCRNIMSRFVASADFRVVVLSGTGDSPAWDTDAKILRDVRAEFR